MSFCDFWGGIQGSLYTATLDAKTQISVQFENTGFKRRKTDVNKKTIQTVHVCKGREAANPS